MQTFEKAGAILFIIIVADNMIHHIIQGRILTAMILYLIVGICLIIIEYLILNIEIPMIKRIYSILIWPYYCVRGIIGKGK